MATRKNIPTRPAGPSQQLVTEDRSSRPMTRINFILMAVCGAMIVLGFCLMAGGATTVDSFNADIFSSRRVVVGPLIAFLGFAAMAFAIMYRPKSNQPRPKD